MNVHTQISDYLATQPERKRDDMQALHGMMLRLMPDCRLWFLDGKDEGGRTVSNPNIGYGLLNIAYADGRTRETPPAHEQGERGNRERLFGRADQSEVAVALELVQERRDVVIRRHRVENEVERPFVLLHLVGVA